MTSACFRRFLRTSPPSFSGSTWNFSISRPALLYTGTSIMVVAVSCQLSVASCYSLRHRGLFFRNWDPRRLALSNVKEPAVWSGQGSFDKQQVFLGVDADQRMVPRGDLIGAHVPGHADTLLGLA